MGDEDEGDVPYAGRYCACGLLADYEGSDRSDLVHREPIWAGDDACPECGAPWPTSLRRRYPYDGGPKLHSMLPEARARAYKGQARAYGKRRAEDLVNAIEAVIRSGNDAEAREAITALEDAWLHIKDPFIRVVGRQEAERYELVRNAIAKHQYERWASEMRDMVDMIQTLASPPTVSIRSGDRVIYTHEVCSVGTCRRPPGHTGNHSQFDGAEYEDQVDFHEDKLQSAWATFRELRKQYVVAYDDLEEGEKAFCRTSADTLLDLLEEL